MAFDSHHLIISNMELIGLVPSSWFELGIQRSDLLPLTLNDKRKCLRLLKNPHILNQKQLW